MRKEPKVKLTRQSECSLHNVRNESVFASEVRFLFFDQIGTHFILRQDKGKLKLELRRLGIGAPRLMKEEVPSASGKVKCRCNEARSRKRDVGRNSILSDKKDSRLSLSGRLAPVSPN